MPNSTPHSIELKTSKPLSKGQPGAWARIVIKHGPEGIAASSAIMMGREEVSSRLYCVHGKTGYHYVVPLSRDLTENEADAIAQAWDQAFPDGDFVINWSQDAAINENMLEVQQDMMKSIAEAAAKRYHSQWYNKKVDESWTFGHKMDPRARKHPMLQPWENLPSAYRNTEVAKFGVLLEVLESMNLKISHG